MSRGLAAPVVLNKVCDCNLQFRQVVIASADDVIALQLLVQGN